MNRQLSAIIRYGRKTAAALLAAVGIVLIGLGIAGFASDDPAAYDALQILAIFFGLAILPTAIAIWSYPRQEYLIGVPFILLPIAFPVSDYLARNLYGEATSFSTIFVYWFGPEGPIWLGVVAIGGWILLQPLRARLPRVRPPQLESLRPWLLPAACVVGGALAFQGLLSLFGSGLGTTGAQTTFATAVIGERSIKVVLGTTPEQSASMARQMCSTCDLVGPEPGKCVGYINFVLFNDLYAIAQDATEAEAKAFIRCSARFPADSCRLVRSKCAAN